MKPTLLSFRNAILLFCLLLFLCAKKDDKKKGFDLKALEKSLCYIPMGSYMFEDSMEMSNNKVREKMVSVNSFYMCNHVVTNNEYHIFLNEIKILDTGLYRKMCPDTLIWRNKLAFMEDMVKYYFSHPAYANYPVVGVSHEQAEYYCKWLTERYMKEPKRKYKNVVFKLPNVYQWDWAALGGLGLSPFPWGSMYLTNSTKKYRGQRMANYMHVAEQAIKRENDTCTNNYGKLVIANNGEGDYMGITGGLNDAADITSPVLSYWPNNYGLYNMAGNVEEYVAEVGITKGGGWADPAYYLQIWVEKPYLNAQSVSSETGFRVIMEIIK